MAASIATFVTLRVANSATLANLCKLICPPLPTALNAWPRFAASRRHKRR